MEKYFYVTTPIYYPSAQAHMGHCYSTVAADVIARYKRFCGYNVKFLTGTDEHGMKIENLARDNGLTPLEFINPIVSKFKDLWKVLNISYDIFIRTTDEAHILTVQKIFKKLYDSNFIYKGTYEGLYCVPCESFWSESNLKDGKCPDCGRDVQKQFEEAYFFKLSEFSEKLLTFFEENQDFLQPKTRKNEMIEFIKNGLEDLCVSRTSFKWGIPVDFDNKHVVYVWIDALSNYISALGVYSEDETMFNNFWPADIHIVGKEIVRFHAIIWPAILMALGIKLPKKVYGHGWLLFGDQNQKMSKSKGNVIDPFTLCERYQTDAIRYFLLREIPFGSDGLFNNKALIDRINFDLANDLGNLISRILSITLKKTKSDIIRFDRNVIYQNPESEKLKELTDSVIENYKIDIENLKFSNVLIEIWKLISFCNKYVDSFAPWNHENDEFLNRFLYDEFKTIKIISILLTSFMPQTSKKIQGAIGINVNSFDDYKEDFSELKIKIIPSLFPRIDVEEELNELDKIDLNSKLSKEKSNVNNTDSVNNSVKKIEETYIDIDDFDKVNLKVGEIVGCEKIKRSVKLLKLIIFDGINNREIVSGIASFYNSSDLIGRRVVFVSNLKPVKICGILSNGMILAGSWGELELNLLFVDSIPPGTRIS